MISLLLLPLPLLPSIQGQTCDMAGMEERIDEKVEEIKLQMKEEMEARMEEKEAVLRGKVREDIEAEMRKEIETKLEALDTKLEEREALLRKELASKGEMGRAVTQGLRDLPYLTLSGYQDSWEEADSTITYDKFLTTFNNGDRPGGADGQLDLGTGVFNCLHDGIYRIDFSGHASLDPSEEVRVYLFLNDVMMPETYWVAFTNTGTIGSRLAIPGSRSLVNVHTAPPALTLLLQMLPLKLGDTLELRTQQCTGQLLELVFSIELSDQGLSTRP